jgi:predicted nucleotidyltransferase
MSKLLPELDDDTVIAIILHGSYARGNALPPYSDIDLVRITKEMPHQTEKKQFIYREGYLISISTRPLSVYRERFSLPEKAIFSVPGVQEAQILLDKNDEFRAFRQDARAWTWEPLQEKANSYASQLMMEQAEIALKIGRALFLHDEIALSDMILDLFSSVTEAIAVQRGVLVRSGNTYFHQVQEAVGLDSTWTRYHLQAAGIVQGIGVRSPIEERGIAMLYLYKETAQLLRSHIHPDHWNVIESVIEVIENTLSHEKRA